jgi:predicted enzyme related to lactoylglutathione lyase
MVERELRAGAELDLGDWFRFDIGVGENLSGATGGKRYPVTAWIGATRWATFHVDLVGTGVRMTGVPDHVSSVVEISIPGIEQPGYRAYPLVDHVADVTSLVACGMPGFSHRNPVSTTRSLCGVGSIASQSDSGVPDVWSIYLATDDAGKTVDAVCANGGQMYVQASAVGDLGTMAVVGDPGGSILRAANEARYGRLAAAADPTGVNPRQRRIVVGRREGAREDSACTVQPTRCLVGVRVVLGANLPQPPSVPTE